MKKPKVKRKNKILKTGKEDSREWRVVKNGPCLKGWGMNGR
jgi:hypothetical protein